MRQCPLVLAGPDSIRQLIDRLKHDTEQFGIISMLKKIRKEQKKGLGLT